MADIRISQCMIVKNEEKNIRRALCWGKEVMWEQIVVDTGSTDKTVEIAKSMGARIYHFRWNDDFSAAKNFAIEKAGGDWIAFLDADEYIDGENAKRLWYFLNQFTRERGKVPAIVTTPLVNLGDDGKPNCVIPKPRIFANCGGIRYIKPIHEYLTASQKIVQVEITDVSIYHTGYTKEAFESQQKVKRNRRMLEREIENDPQDPWNYCYMGDILAVSMEKKEALKYYKDAVRAYREFDKSRRASMDVLACSAYCGILKMLYEIGEADEEEFVGEYEKGLELCPDFPDLDLWRGKWAYGKEDWAGTIRYLEQGMEKQNRYEGEAPCTLKTQLKEVSKFIMTSAMNLGDKNRVLKYSILGLQIDRCSEEHFAALVSALSAGTREDDRRAVWDFLKKIYSISNLKDLLFIYKCAKLLNDQALLSRVLEVMPPKERARLTEEKKAALPAEIAVRNGGDASFANFMGQIHRASCEEIEEAIGENAARQKEKSEIWYKAVSRFTSSQPHHGAIDGEGREGLPGLRARMLKEGEEGLCRLYEKLEDYRSKTAFFNVLSNLYYLDPDSLTRAADNGPAFLDPDILGDMSGKALAEVGAFKGDLTRRFTSLYKEYKQVYCYEASPEAANYLEYSIYSVKNVQIRRKALFSEAGSAYLAKSAYSAAMNYVTAKKPQKGEFTQVETVTLDQDLEEAADLIVIDTAGCELEVLKGCKGRIAKNHPALAVNIGNRPENLYLVFQALEEMGAGYSYYFRYCGGNILPEKCVLYAVKR